jgi:hypothetical protein
MSGQPLPYYRVQALFMAGVVHIELPGGAGSAWDLRPGEPSEASEGRSRYGRATQADGSYTRYGIAWRMAASAGCMVHCVLESFRS